MAINLDSIRCELAMLAKRKKARVVAWNPDTPNDWRPTQIKHPITGGFFTEVAAWQLIAELLDGGHPLEEIILIKPPGKRAYVMHVELVVGQPKLYLKLELGSGKVIGRSFHYSYR